MQATDTLTALDFAIQPLGAINDAAVQLITGSPFRAGFVSPLTLVVSNNRFSENITRNGPDWEQLSLAGYPAAVYFLMLEAEGRKHMTKIIKL